MVIDEPLGNLLIVVFTGDHTGGPSPWRVGLLKISHVCRDRCYDNLTGGLLWPWQSPGAPLTLVIPARYVLGSRSSVPLR